MKKYKEELVLELMEWIADDERGFKRYYPYSGKECWASDFMEDTITTAELFKLFLKEREDKLNK